MEQQQKCPFCDKNHANQMTCLRIALRSLAIRRNKPTKQMRIECTTLSGSTYGSGFQDQSK